jgi:hypothetical protein
MTSGTSLQDTRWPDEASPFAKLYMSQSEALEAVGLSEQDAHADS